MPDSVLHLSCVRFMFILHDFVAIQGGPSGRGWAELGTRTSACPSNHLTPPLAYGHVCPLPPPTPVIRRAWNVTSTSCSLLSPPWPLGTHAQWGAAKFVWPDPRVLCSSQDVRPHAHHDSGKETVTKMCRGQLCYLFWSLCSPASFHCKDSHPITGSH